MFHTLIRIVRARTRRGQLEDSDLVGVSLKSPHLRFLAYLQLAPQQPPSSGSTPALSCHLAKGAGKLPLTELVLPPASGPLTWNLT